MDVSTAHGSVYTAHMREKRDCWVCEVCGFAWLVRGKEIPTHCASSKCRSRKWNGGAVEPRKVKPVKKVEPAPAVVKPDPLIEALEAAASGDVEPVAVSRVPAVVAVVSDVVVPVKTERTAACPECGGMSGCHQRGCKRKGKA